MVHTFFPFHRLNLTRNPFGSLAPEEWAEIVILPREVIEAVEAGCKYFQIVGEKGRGKTSVLLGLKRLLVRRGIPGAAIAYERIPEGGRHFHTALDGLEWFLLDEAQRLGWWEWRRLLRAARGGLRLAIGSHADHTRGFARYGVRLITVRLGRGITAEEVGAIFQTRIEYSRLDRSNDRVCPYLTTDALDALITRYGSDLRAMESLLYEVFQGVKEPGPITADTLALYLNR